MFAYNILIDGRIPMDIWTSDYVVLGLYILMDSVVV